MSELKEKIAEAIGNHISISDTYTYELTRVKTAFEAGTISLEDFEEWSDENVNNLAESIVGVLQPQLNDNQKIVLEWLKEHLNEDSDPLGVICGMQKFGLQDENIFDAIFPMDNQKQFEILLAFAQWGLEQEGTE
ncbi:hypothetical protein K5E_25410 [Enterococcus thailandicus]|uniref:hypothetical protein n=1 Tax=Enterococcus thailandicus TaxID=417368 RepID=UPI00244D8C69|nr:hypothetical protein [Enterococcus thailandicus]GMC10402.1 hypothetical protein K5E_25410 [Enterococcus thailandicus]